MLMCMKNSKRLSNSKLKFHLCNMRPSISKLTSSVFPYLSMTLFLWFSDFYSCGLGVIWLYVSLNKQVFDMKFYCMYLNKIFYIYFVQAAHCFTDLDGTIRNKRRYTIIAGKHYRNKTQVENNIQESKVSTIRI